MRDCIILRFLSQHLSDVPAPYGLLFLFRRVFVYLFALATSINGVIFDNPLQVFNNWYFALRYHFNYKLLALPFQCSLFHYFWNAIQLKQTIINSRLACWQTGE
jgi:hypothetical protein